MNEHQEEEEDSNELVDVNEERLQIVSGTFGKGNVESLEEHNQFIDKEFVSVGDSNIMGQELFENEN